MFVIYAAVNVTRLNTVIVFIVAHMIICDHVTVVVVPVWNVLGETYIHQIITKKEMFSERLHGPASAAFFVGFMGDELNLIWWTSEKERP